MLRPLLALLFIGLAACKAQPAPGPDAGVPGPQFSVTSIEDLLAAMSLEEKVEQMHGLSLAPIDGLYATPENSRLGIPGMRMVDGPRGVRAGHATAFPVAMARGATWDVDLERRVGEAIGHEAAAKGADVLLAPTLNLLRHPAWGRAQETYGEDTVHLGAMGVAFIQGAQQHVLASTKHLAVYSIEDTRTAVDVRIDERSLRELYLPHFRRAVLDGRVGSVMTAYNSVNGDHASESTHLLKDILKGEWGFQGFVGSDWVFGTRSTVPSANAGLDLEMPSAIFFGSALVDAVRGGQVPESAIDEAVTRILRAKKTLATLAQAVDPAAVESAEHVALARQVAIESMVLLKNEGALPIARRAGGSLAIVGALADVANLGDKGSSNVTPSQTMTPRAGLEAAAAPLTTVFLPGPLSPADHAAIAAADAAIVVVGLTTDDEGEGLLTQGGDRETLHLSPEHEALIADVASVARRTIVVMEGGSAIVVRPWIDRVQGLLMAWYPGMQGGAAIASVLFGDGAPGGRLPLTFPRAEADLPPFDHTSTTVQYGFLHGYRWLDAHGTAPEFPFGFGLGYTTFAFANLKAQPATLTLNDSLSVQVDVTNTGARAGDAVVQTYLHVEGSAVERAPIDLRGFARVSLAPGETKTATIAIAASELAYWDVATRKWILEPASYTVEVGSSSRDLPVSASFVVP